MIYYQNLGFVGHAVYQKQFDKSKSIIAMNFAVKSC